MILKDALTHFSERLSNAQIFHPRKEALWLISHILKEGPSQLLLKKSKLLDQTTLDHIEKLISRREKGEPFAYITGEVHFFGVNIKVNPSVLIPRVETELLAEKIACALSQENLENKTLWDLCTGSGALAISLKKKFPLLKVFASDISHLALQLAKENSLLNQVTIEFYEGDLFKPFKDKTCDFFVANPPYVDESDWSDLSSEVRDFEPPLALIAKKRGLEFYERIASGLKKHLNPSGKAWLEIGKDQGKDVKNIFLDFNSVLIEKDLSNHDRFIILK